MRLTLACVCDAATVSSDGKINILGEFNTMFAGKFPAVHPHMAYVARIEVDGTDSRKVVTALRLLDDDGKAIIATPQMLMSIGASEPGETVGIPFVLDLTSAKFPHAGTYTFELTVNGTRVGETFLYVKTMTPPGARPA